MSNRNVLLRRYLCKRLAEYYSQPADKVVGSIGPGCSGIGKHHNNADNNASRSGVNFASLVNEWHWKHTYKRVYEDQRGMWLTPVELFYPHYSNVLANFVSESMETTMMRNNLPRHHHHHGDNNNDNNGIFEIVELGGGRGTNAKALLNHLSEYHTEIYERLHRYTIFDTSPTLHKLQEEVLIDGSRHADKVKLVNIDMMDVAEGNSEFLTPSDVPTAVIALELLDNLPHDKIGRCMETGDILQAEVVPVVSAESDLFGEAVEEGSKHHHQHQHDLNRLDTSQPYMETFSPLTDPLLQHILSLAPSIYTPMASHGPRWVPTVAIGILMKLFETRPNCSVAFADFDWLPPPDVGSWSDTQQYSESNLHMVERAAGNPLVTDMRGNDHPCYLTSPPDALCDILFPTDFRRLAAFTNNLTHTPLAEAESKAKSIPVTASAMKQSEFLMKYGSGEVNKTKGWTGFSPMINDFGNCSVMTVTPGSTSKMQKKYDSKQ